MALFGSRRDAHFIAAINSELINHLVDTEVEFYKLIIETTESNIYGEADSKSYYMPILLPALINKDNKSSTMDDYGHDYERPIQLGLSRDLLEKSKYYPEVGDILFWDNEYYEVHNVDANQYLAGKNPDTWANGSTHGYSVSVVVDAHITRQTIHNIKDIRHGGSTNEYPYKGH